MSANARVKLTLELDYEAGRYTDDATVEFIRRQAEREATNATEKLIEAARAQRLTLRLLKIDHVYVLTFEEKRP